MTNLFKNYKGILSNFLSLSSLQLINYIFPLITFPYIISVIGLEKFGILALATATSNYFSSFIDFGFNISATRDISRYRHNKKALNLIYNKVFSIKLYLFLISIFIFSIIIFSVESFYIYKEVYFFTFSNIIGLSLLPLWFFMGIEDMKYIAIFNAISKTVFLLLLLIFIKNEDDFWIIPLLTSIGSLLVGVIAIIYIKQKYGIYFRILKLNRVYNETKKKYEIFLVHYIPILYSNSVYTILGIYTDNITVGIYSVAEKVMMIFNSLLYLITNSFYPAIVKDLSKFDVLKKIMFSVGILLTITIYLSSPCISDFLVGDQTTTYYLELISLTFLFTAMYATYGLTYLIVQKRDKLIKMINIYISISAMLYTLVAVIEYGLVGAVFSIIFTRLLFASISFYFYKGKIWKQ